MYILVNESGEFSVGEMQDLTALKLVTVLTQELLIAAFDKKFGPGCLPGAEHAWIATDWLFAQGPTADRVWAHNFEKMMEYANRKGWMHPTSAAVRVHIERTTR